MNANYYLTGFRSRMSRLEWKTFQVTNANEEAMQSFLMPYRVESQLLSFMEKKTRFPVSCISNYHLHYLNNL